jgi:hypothetical protein
LQQLPFACLRQIEKSQMFAGTAAASLCTMRVAGHVR